MWRNQGRSHQRTCWRQRPPASRFAIVERHPLRSVGGGRMKPGRRRIRRGSYRQLQSSSLVRSIGRSWPLILSASRGVGVPASKATYIDNAAESTNSIGSVDSIGTATSVLHNCAGNHNNILSRVGKLLDDKVDHLAEAGILVLEELRDTEKEGCSFVCRELLSCVEKKGDLCEENATSSRLDRGAVEESCWRTI